MRIFTPLGGIGVAIFLFLSGYGLEESFKKNQLKNFWVKKGVRIFIPYILWIPMLWTVSYIFSLDTPLIPRYWYLEYLFLWYIIFWISKHFNRNIYVTVLIIAAIIFFISMSNIRAEQSLSFIAGIFLSDNVEAYRRQSISKKAYCAIILITFGVICLGLKQLPQVRQFGEEGVIMKIIQLGIKLPIGIGIILIGDILYRNNIATRILSYIGIISLELYLVQMQFYHLIQGSCIMLLLITLVVIILSLLLHHVSEFVIRRLPESIVSKSSTIK